MHKIKREIKFEADRDPNFAATIKETPDCENLDKCIQCGTCSGACPLSIYMDYTPRRVIELTRSGFKEEVLSSSTIWLCASCYACTVECPKEIGITNIMYALKQKAIEDKKYPKGLPFLKEFPIPVLARLFHSMVRKRGRISEGLLVMQLFMRTQPLKGLGMIKLGWDLVRTGRITPNIETIKGPKQLTNMIDSVKQADGGAQS